MSVFLFKRRSRRNRTGWQRILSENGRLSEKESAGRISEGYSDANPGQVNFWHGGQK